MTRSAPRIGPRLREAIVAAGRDASAADVTRHVGALAWQLGLTRPSYQQVREILNESREQSRRMPTAKDVLLDVAFRARPADDLLDLLAGTPLPHRPGAVNEPPEEPLAKLLGIEGKRGPNRRL